MVHAFKTIPAKPTFGNIRPNMFQSDYIKRKKALSTFQSKIFKKKSSYSYDTKYLLNKGKYYGINNCDILPVNKSNLIAGQYTKMDLQDVCDITTFSSTIDPSENDCIDRCTSVQLDPSVIFYENYVVDPCGQLFGNSQCGELNYTHYMVYYPPSK